MIGDLSMTMTVLFACCRVIEFIVHMLVAASSIVLCKESTTTFFCINDDSTSKSGNTNIGG